MSIRLGAVSLPRGELRRYIEGSKSVIHLKHGSRLPSYLSPAGLKVGFARAFLTFLHIFTFSTAG